MASNGDTIAMTGSGSIGVHPKSATGGGTFTHKNAAGTTLASGTWTATDLLSFKDYGTDPSLPPTLHGGNALILVNLFIGSTLVHTGILDVDCAIGKVPSGHGEGVRRVVQGGLNFNTKVSGFTVFIDP